MPMLDKLKTAVQQCLERREWLVTPDAARVVDEMRITQEMGKPIVCRLAHRWQHEAPEHNIHIQLATLFQKTSLQIKKNDKQYDEKIYKHKRLKRTLDSLLSTEPADGESIRHTRAQISSYNAWFESELTTQIFLQLESLIKTPPPPFGYHFSLKHPQMRLLF